MKEELTHLLDKYYRGETTPAEEVFLRKELKDSGENTPENDIFGYYATRSALPEEMEELLFDRIEEKSKRKKLRFSIYVLSAAATLALLITLYSGYQNQQKAEKDFKTMEQALSIVSESLQPEKEEPDMLVLWVDDNVEVIIN